MSFGEIVKIEVGPEGKYFVSIKLNAQGRKTIKEQMKKWQTAPLPEKPEPRLTTLGSSRLIWGEEKKDKGGYGLVQVLPP